MAAETLIVEDAYQRGYADAIADMRKKKEQRRQREQAKKAVPLGLMCIFSKKMLIVDNYYFEAEKGQTWV